MVSTHCFLPALNPKIFGSFFVEKAVLVESALVLVHVSAFFGHYLFIILANKGNQEVKEHDEDYKLLNNPSDPDCADHELSI